MPFKSLKSPTFTVQVAILFQGNMGLFPRWPFQWTMTRSTNSLAIDGGLKHLTSSNPCRKSGITYEPTLVDVVIKWIFLLTTIPTDHAFKRDITSFIEVVKPGCVKFSWVSRVICCNYSHLPRNLLFLFFVGVQRSCCMAMLKKERVLHSKANIDRKRYIFLFVEFGNLTTKCRLV